MTPEELAAKRLLHDFDAHRRDNPNCTACALLAHIDAITDANEQAWHIIESWLGYLPGEEPTDTEIEAVLALLRGTR